MLEILWNDLKYAARSLRRTPGFTAAAVLTLGLGIGANTALFTLFDVVVLRALPVEAPGELFLVRETDPAYSGTEAEDRRLARFSYTRFLELQAALPANTSLAAMSRVTRVIVRSAGEETPAVARGQLVSSDFFDTFDVGAVRGRLLREEDNQANAAPVAVISHAYWQRQFAGVADAVGRALVVNGTPVTIVGVAAPGFTGGWADDPAQLWFPVVMQHALGYRGNASADDVDINAAWVPQDRVAWLNLVGRAPRVMHAAVQQQLALANRPGLQRYAEATRTEDGRRAVLGRGLRVEPFARGFSTVRLQYANALFVLAAMVGLVLLVACVNVANLLLARAAARHGEIALRLSLGATRLRLARQLLTESVLLAVLGGASGVFLGLWASRLLAAMVSAAVQESIPATPWPDLRVLAFSAAISLAAAVLFGLLPAIRASRLDVRGGSAGPRAIASVRGMRPLVASQIGMCFVVVVAAALLGRSLLNIARFDPGFDRGRLVAVTFDPFISGYAADRVSGLHQRLLGAVETVPGVTSAAVSMLGVVGGGQSITDYRLEGHQPVVGDSVEVNTNFVGPAYFETLGMPMLEGRGFTDGDGLTARPVAVINETLARRYFGTRPAVGLRLGEDQLDTEIVGVVRDARVIDLRSAPVPMVYFPIAQGGVAARAIDVRVSGDPALAVAALREAIRRVEPALHLDSVRPLDEQLDRNAQRETQVAYLSTAFGVLALLLACVGLYGVLSYTVSRRTREVGVRVAVGASPRDILLLILRDGAEVGIGGLIAGVALAFAARGALAAVLFEVSATDPVTYAGVAAMLGLVTAAACYFPARRAAGIDPNVALRTE